MLDCILFTEQLPRNISVIRTKLLLARCGDACCCETHVCNKCIIYL